MCPPASWRCSVEAETIAQEFPVVALTSHALDAIRLLCQVVADTAGPPVTMLLLRRSSTCRCLCAQLRGQVFPEPQRRRNDRAESTFLLLEKRCARDEEEPDDTRVTEQNEWLSYGSQTAGQRQQHREPNESRKHPRVQEPLPD